jgi:glutamyl-tRNA reductase
VKENLSRRATEIDRAEAIVRQEVDKFAAWLQSREVLPTVIALRQRFDEIRQAELKRLEGKLAPLSPEARERVDEITHLIVEKLLLTPTEQLKSTRDETLAVTYSDAVNRLFALQSAKAPDEPGENS